MRKTITFIGVLTAIFALLHSCANPTYPTGGEKDSLPPKLLSVTPKDSTIQFKDNEIVFTFDEFVQVQNPLQNVIITPNPTIFPEIVAKRNNLYVRFKEPLIDSTTYTISFGSSLKDNNEGNAYNNLQYVFSTGEKLDSLTLKGSISFIGDKFPQNVYVVMYRDTVDTLFLTKRPDYIYKTDEKGNFEFKNLQAGIFSIFAIGDKNYNYFYDNLNEEIGFFEKPVFLNSDSVQNIRFSFFLPEQEKLYFTDFPQVLTQPQLTAKLNKEIDKVNVYRLSCIEPENIPNGILQNDRKSFLLWFPENAEKGMCLFGFYKNDTLLDSVRISYELEIANLPAIKLTPENVNKQNQVFVSPQGQVKFETNIPLLNPTDSTGVFLIQDSTIKDKVEYMTDNQQIILNNFPKIKQPTSLRFLPGSLRSWYNTKNEDTIVFQLKQYVDEDLGLLSITYNFPDSSMQYLIQVFSAEKSVILDTLVSGVKVFKWTSEGILPGNYSSQVVFDVDRNGIRSFGSFAQKILPEILYVYDKPIQLKNNWEFEVEINVSSATNKPSKSFDGNVNNPSINDDEGFVPKKK